MLRGLNRLIIALTPSTVRRSYAIKFVVSILAVIVVISSVGAFGYVQARDSVVDDTEDQLRSTADGRAQSVGVWLADKRSLVRTLSADDALQGGQQYEIRRFLNQKQVTITRESGDGSSRSQIRNLHLVDTDNGTILASTDADATGLGFEAYGSDPWADTALYDDVPTNGVWTSPTVYSSERGGKDVLAFASPVPGTEQALVVVGSYDRELRTVFNVQGDRRAAVVGQDGATVTGQSTAFTAEQARSVFAGAESGASLFESDDRVFAYSAVPGSQQGWVVVTSAEKGRAFAVADTVGQIIGLIIGLALISLGLVGFVLGRQTVTPLSRLRGKVERMEEGNLDVDLRTDRVDEIGRLYGGFDAMRNSLRDQIRRTQRTNRHLEEKATEYSEVMRDAAAGDLTRRMDPSAENDAMADVAAEFNEMIAELERTTDEVKSFASQVAISSQAVTASAETVRDASEQVTDSVEEISDGTERQDERLQSITREMNALRATVDDIADSTSEVATVAARTVETGREGRESARAAIDRMDRATDDSAAAVEEIRRLEAEVEQVDELIEFVNGIARQTNMLALNANIEATRSGDAGDGGFGAIANEIKQLSEEAQDATENIEARLERIQEQTGDAADVVDQTSRRIGESAERVRAAAAALEEITEYAERTNDGVQEIDEANAGQVASATEVADAVEEVANIGAETARTSETVAALARRQTAATNRMSDSATELNGRADRLRSTLDDFETDSTADDETAGEPEAAAESGDDAAGFDPGATGGSSDDPVGFDPRTADDEPSADPRDGTQREAGNGAADTETDAGMFAADLADDDAAD
jgi:methyl-accepting chemotaxis protein